MRTPRLASGGWTLLYVLLAAHLLTIGACAYSPAPPDGQIAPALAADAATRDTRKEIAALRADLAAARIQLAKKEAEIRTLQQLLADFRKSESDLRTLIGDQQAELFAIRAERDQLQQAQPSLKKETPAHEAGIAPETDRSQDQPDLRVEMRSLHSSVSALSAELTQLRQEALAMKQASREPVPSSTIPSLSTGPTLQTHDSPFLSLPPPSNRTTGGSPSTVLETQHVGLALPREAAPRLITVRPGDSLSALARRYGCSVEALKKANGLRNDRVKVGQQLRIPSGPPQER
jgi:LysM repeat protein